MFTMDASKELNLKNPIYKKAVIHYVWQAYLDDLGKGDITTDFFVPNKRRVVKAEIIAKEIGVFAGVLEAELFLKKLGVNITQRKKDGSKLKKGDVVMCLSGSADKILAGERTLLNLLQRMSGVATATNKLFQKVPKSIRILATRKTFWGDLDKRAVSVGGGCTHRLSLNDAVLIKENHIALIDDMRKFHKGFKRVKGIRFIEIEFENLAQIKIFLEYFEKYSGEPDVVIMLDNFKPDDVRRAVKLLDKTDVLIEVSGGINEKNINKYAIKGVSTISSGAITNKASALDLSLSIMK